MYDILIRDGVLLDGAGNEGRKADIGIKDGRIVAIGRSLDGSAGEIIDAQGKYVSPGFIDIHRHADANVFSPSFGEIELAQGITTIVNGNCGLSISPCPEPYKDQILDFLEPIVGKIDKSLPIEEVESYYRCLERQGLPLNVGSCIGNGTVRMAAKGFDNGELSPVELERAHNFLRSGLEAGALGVTMGIVYAPENCYDQDGFIKVLEPMRDYQVPLVTHIRGYGDLLHESLNEVIAIAKALDVPLHISHFMAVGKQNWGVGLNEALAILDRARDSGMQISCDVYPYTAGASQLIQILPPWYQDGGVTEIVKRLSDPARRRELVEILRKPQTKFENLVYSSGWDSLLITTVGLEKNQKYVGKTITQIAEMQGKDPYDCAFDLLIEENCNVTMVIFITDERDILNLLRYPYSCIISDSIYPKSGIPHPRLYGAFPKVLSEYVRNRKLLELPAVIRKMTSDPAKLYRIGKKGLLREGYDADIVVFDLNEIATKADYTDAKRLAEGMYRVIVNGKVTYCEGHMAQKRAGRLLRRKDEMTAG